MRKQIDKLLKSPNDKVCYNCGSDKVQTKMWVEINSSRIIGTITVAEILGESFLDEYDIWCPSCENHVRTCLRKEYNTLKK
jgi:hypothetical protein